MHNSFPSLKGLLQYDLEIETALPCARKLLPPGNINEKCQYHSFSGIEIVIAKQTRGYEQNMKAC